MNDTPFEPEIVVFYCQNCIQEGFDPGAIDTADSACRLRLSMLPCSSKIECRNVLRVLERGTDGVLVVGCPEKQCRFLVGSATAEKRIDYARRLLDEVGMGAERAAMYRRTNMTADDLVGLAEERAQAVKPLGPNRMKGA